MEVNGVENSFIRKRNMLDS